MIWLKSLKNNVKFINQGISLSRKYVPLVGRSSEVNKKKVQAMWVTIIEEHVHKYSKVKIKVDHIGKASWQGGLVLPMEVSWINKKTSDSRISKLMPLIVVERAIPTIL